MIEKLIEMGNSKAQILAWQRRRKIVVLTLLVIAVPCLFYSGYISAFLLASAIGYFYLGRKSIDNNYREYRYHAELEFVKFARVVLPYLEEVANERNLYHIFSKVKFRVNDQLRRRLEVLMMEMNENSNSIEPYKKFAHDLSDSHFSYLFMESLFDIQMGTSDLDIIAELSERANKELLAKIDVIIARKLRKFSYVPTKLTMSNFILVAGYAACILLFEIARMG
ncbi:MAG: hypothetical protein LBN08_03880 [Lactobacillales bacterium]|jgi:hypothetical protein|nr:hypothetical protein [Lactobacillales bacterium]